MHLTNYSVNKLSEAFVQNKDDGKDAKVGDDYEEADEPEEEGVASKWSFAELRKYMEQHDLDYDVSFERINDLVIKTLLAVEPQLSGEWCRALDKEGSGWGARGAAGAHPASCFETYGFDVLIDQDLKPWLLEVNICPSLSSGSPLDKRIKTQLVADTLTLVGIQPLQSIYRRDLQDVSAQEDESNMGRMPAADVLAQRKTRLAIANRRDALAIFDEYAWDIVLKAHEEDMRCGGLCRIFPREDSSQYTAYFTEESYANLVLRKFYEAGGGDIFGAVGDHNVPVPPWVPRRVSSATT